MFEKVIDLIIIQYYNKLKEIDSPLGIEEFPEQSRERKEMDELIRAIVILYQNKTTRL